MLKCLIVSLLLLLLFLRISYLNAECDINHSKAKIYISVGNLDRRLFNIQITEIEFLHLFSYQHFTAGEQICHECPCLRCPLRQIYFSGSFACTKQLQHCSNCQPRAPESPCATPVDSILIILQQHFPWAQLHHASATLVSISQHLL